MTTRTTHDFAKAYVAAGLALVPIPAGSKAPTTFGWQTKAAPADFWDKNPTHNIGLLHALSGTVALDIDHMENSKTALAALGIDLADLIKSAPRIIGRPDRGKAIFKAPIGFALTTRKISWPVDGDPRRTEVVFELRAGSVQDVLPPSIHPDTGNPYEWAGADWRDGFPELPPQLLMIWDEWDRFRPQLMDACPWKRAPEFVPPRKVRPIGDQGTSVISAYNDAHPIDAALEAAGYKRVGKRWLSPNSTSGICGVVVFDDDRAFSHHASDPFDPAHTFDAFDLFCHYQHMGNVGAAVRAAGEMLDIKSLPTIDHDEREHIAHGRKVAESWRKAPSAQAIKTTIGVDDVPPHLLTVQGMLGEVVKYSRSKSVKAQPQFDVQAALALGSVLMGRRFMTDYNNMTSLYFLNIAKTGTGKENANNVISTLLDRAGLDHLHGPAGYTSEGGVLSALNDKPCHIAMIDEFGNYLQAAGNKGSVNLQQAFSMLMEAFGRQRGVLQNRGYSTVAVTDKQKQSMQIKVRSPSLTMLAMTTPDSFYDAITYKDAASGFLNRILTVESRLPYSKSKKPAAIDPPDHLIQWMQATASAEGQGGNLSGDNGAEFPPTPVMIPFSAAAADLLDAMEEEIVEAQNGSAKQSDADMMIRTREIAMRLSLIVAHSMGEKEISVHATRWAIDYTTFYAKRTLEMLSDHMSEGDTDTVRKKCAAAIKASGLSGLRMAEMVKAVPALGNMNKMARDNLLAVVCDDYEHVERVQEPPKGGRGRPSIIHRWNNS